MSSMSPAPAAPIGETFPRLDDQATSLRDFLRDVLPDQGNVCTWEKNSPSRAHRWFDNLEALARKIEHHGDKLGVYFGTAAYGDQEQKRKDGAPIPGSIARTQGNVTGRKCFHLDLDAGKAKIAKHESKGEEWRDKIYETQADALKDVDYLEAAMELPATYVVSSGEGLHVYWCLSETVSGEEWTRCAEMFSSALKLWKVKQDHACTKDSSRVLRPLGTMHENGKRVSLLRATGKLHALAEFLAPIEERVRAAASPKPAGVGAGSLKVAKVATPDNDGGELHDFEEIRGKCQVLRHVAEVRGNVSEPLWRGALGIVKHCSGGEDLAHQVSDGHPDYDQGETRAKFEGWKGGPTTCAELGQHDDCSGCAHLGRIKSPIQLDTQRQRQQPRLIQLPTGVTKPNGAALRQHLPDWFGKEGDDGAFIKTRPMNTTDNVAALAALTGYQLRYNVMTKRPEIHFPGLLASRDDYDNAALARFGDVAVRAGLARTGLAELTDAVAGDNQFHPCLEWIESKPWDGVSRTAAFHASFELADSSRRGLADKLIDAWMLQGCGALREPYGIKAEGALVLAGPQGCGKTRKISNLCPLPGAVIIGAHLDPQDKDLILQATSAWITELGELDTTTRKADVGALKAFITKDVDIVRPAYTKRENQYRRRTIFAGTVNGTGFLVDDTGNRRFWVIEVTACQLFEPDEMQQIWAEYLHRYDLGDRWHLDEAAKVELNESNAEYTATDTLQELIARAFEWQSVDWDGIDKDRRSTWEGVDWMTASEICQLIGMDGKHNATRAGGIVRDLQNRVAPDRGISRKSNGTKLLAVPVMRRELFK